MTTVLLPLQVVVEVDHHDVALQVAFERQTETGFFT
jgi:hypothetical protein